MMSWQMAEELAAAHLRELGFTRVTRTPAGADGGIDVSGDEVVAQVKHWNTPTGIAEIQRLKGIAQSVNAVFYSHSGFTRAAQTWALENTVSLFRYDNTNMVFAVNEHASTLMLNFGMKDIPRRVKRLTMEYFQFSEASKLHLDSVLEYFTNNQHRLNNGVAIKYAEFAVRIAEFEDIVREIVQNRNLAGGLPTSAELDRLQDVLNDWKNETVEFWQKPIHEVLPPETALLWTAESGWYWDPTVNLELLKVRFSDTDPPPHALH